MSLVSLEQALFHARIDDECSDSNTQRYYQLQLDSAIEKCTNHLNRTVAKTAEELKQLKANGDKDAILFNKSMASAVYIWFTYLVDNKQGENQDSVEQSVASLLSKYRLTPGI